MHPDLRDRVPPGTAAIVTREPYIAWAKAAALFHPRPPTQPGIHPTALVDPTARVDPSAEIGPFAVVAADLETAIRTGCLDLDQPRCPAEEDPVEAVRERAAQLLCAAYCYVGPDRFVLIGGLAVIVAGFLLLLGRRF